MKLRKINALLLAFAMVLSLSVAAFAADSKNGQEEGTGNVGFTYEEEVFDVVFPTNPVAYGAAKVFDFTMDPQNVLASTQNAHYDDDTDYYEYYVYTPSTVYFYNYIDWTDDTSDYYAYYANYRKVISDKSDPVTIYNKGGSEVSVSVEAEASELGNISLVSTKDFDSDAYYASKPMLYLALADDTNTKPIDATNGATLTATVAARPDSYEITYDEGTKKFEYKLQEGLEQDDFEHYSYSFHLTGACNSQADWTKLGTPKPTPKVTVKWTVEKVVDPVAPAMTELVVSLTPNGTAQPFDLSELSAWDLGQGAAKATKIASIKYPAELNMTDNQKNFVTLDGDTSIKVNANGTIYLTNGTLSNYYYVLVLNDTAATEVEIRFTLAN